MGNRVFIKLLGLVFGFRPHPYSHTLRRVRVFPSPKWRGGGRTARGSSEGGEVDHDAPSFIGRIALALVLGVATIASSIGLMMTSAWLISTAALQLGIVSLGVAPTAVRFFGISRAVFRYLERLVSHDVTFRLLARLRVWFYERIESLSPAQIDSFSSGDLIARIVSDIEELQNLYLRALSPPLVAVIVIALTGLAFSFFDLLAAGVLILFMVVGAVLLPLFTGWIGRRYGPGVIAARTQINIQMVDSIQGLADSTAFGYSKIRSAELDQTGQRLSAEERRMARVDSIQGGLSVGLVNLAAVAVLYAALGRVDGVYLGTLALGTLAAFEAITPLALAAQNLGKELTAAQRVFEIIEAEPVIRPPAESKPLPPTDRSLTLEHVTFRYGPEESYVFRDFSLDVPDGAKVAVMGPSGSGKSSLVNLLLRFWEYEGGRITIGGMDLRMLDHETVRHTFGVMTQRTHLFNTTIAENIRIAWDDASDEDIIRAAQAAQVHDFILLLPDGYDTFVGENGVALSGGERQRVAMARVILKDSPVWLLDEFTANLDPVTAHALMRSVLDVARARSVIVITHRVGLVDQGAFDRVVRLEGGEDV